LTIRWRASPFLPGSDDLLANPQALGNSLAAQEFFGLLDNFAT